MMFQYHAVKLYEELGFTILANVDDPKRFGILPLCFDKSQIMSSEVSNAFKKFSIENIGYTYCNKIQNSCVWILAVQNYIVDPSVRYLLGINTALLENREFVENFKYCFL